ncbi:MAG: LysM peptidoglycan-binding domain-containing protein [Marinilabiliales bacterium]|nr:MAG: LysM peptidoglycan-binding domain-containing protein [Marinilabiliales bacterium]
MFIKYFLIIICGILFHAGVNAQTEPVEVTRSDDRIVIGGEVYYIHVVKTGQTLYSISRVYNVPQKELMLENPTLYVTDLQAGQTLKIPFRPEPEEEVVDHDPGGDYILHTIEPGQTLFFLSRTYDVGVDEIKKHNPGIDEDDLQINQIVRIPSKRVFISREGFPTRDDKYIHHKVERGETISSISRLYDVPARDIRRSNEKLMWGLKYGEYIRIPRYTVDEEEPPADTDVLADELPDDPWQPDLYDPEIVSDAACIGFEYEEYGRPYRVSLLLPLYLERNWPVELPDTVDMEEAADLYPEYVLSVDELYQGTVPFLEFYEGARLAVDSLVRAGLSVVLNVYDTERSTEKVSEILKDREFRQSDLVIGPVYPENMRIVSEWARDNRVNIVSPLTSRREFISDNPYLFQVTPSSASVFEQASIFISNFPSSNFVLIHRDDPWEGVLIEDFKSSIFRHFSYNSNFENLVFKEVIYTDATVNIEQSLVTEGSNIIIVPSTDQAFVSNILMRLNILSRNYDITIFGMNEWQRFSNIEVEYLHNMEFHFASPYYIDYGDPNVRRFLALFRDKYKTEPLHYGFHGYDIMFYFLQAMKRYGPDFRDCLPVMRTDLLQADYLFRKTGHGSGLENNGISIVRYRKDMNIERLGLNARTP